jgi:hypothetical protein
LFADFAEALGTSGSGKKIRTSDSSANAICALNHVLAVNAAPPVEIEAVFTDGPNFPV